MNLHYKKMGAGEPLIVLHGLMGMLDNWLTPAKRMAEHFEVILVDQRNHGHSPHDRAQSYEAMMDDLLELMETLELEEAHLLGHSMGGKTVMKFAQNFPEMVGKLVVVDIAPKAYPVHHEMILKGLRALDLDNIQRRSGAEKVLENYIPENGVRQFLLKNLYWKEKGQLALRFNLDAIETNITDMGEAIQDQMYNGSALFVRGGDSDYIQDGDLPFIDAAFPNYELATVKDAGHWVHATQPTAFLDAVMGYLLK